MINLTYIRSKINNSYKGYNLLIFNDALYANSRNIITIYVCLTTTMNVKTNVISFHPHKFISVYGEKENLMQISYDEWAKYCDPNGIYREICV